MTSPQLVGTWSIVFMCATLLLSIGVPVALAIWAKLRYRKAFSFVPLLLGAAAFFLFQLVIRITALQLLSQLAWFVDFATNYQWIYIALLAFTAGLFEEPPRFLVYSILKKRRSFVDGLSYGIGHGGIESVMLVGMSYISNLTMAFMINTGTIDTLLQATPESARGALQAGVTALTTTGSDLFLAAGVERVFTVFVQIALSLLVMRGFQTGQKWLYLALAIAVHTAIDFVAVALQKVGLSPWALEGVIAGFGILSLLYIVGLARRYAREQPKAETELYSQQA